MRIGPVRLPGRRMEADLTLAGVKTRTLLRWLDRDVVEGADGLVSVHALPFESVAIERRTAAPGERELILETRNHDSHGVHMPVAIGGRRIAARLSFSRTRTTAPAAAAAVIIGGHGGAVSTEPGGTEEISLGIHRPVYLLELERPLALGALAVPRIMVRAADFRGRHRLARRSEAQSGDAIVVMGARDSQEALYRITIGLDVLDRCSAATYRRASGELRLRCAE
jgi:hypothetical protein